MATFCAFDSFIITTGIVGTTFTRVFTDSASGATFQPTFVFLFWTGHPFGGSGIGRQDMLQGRGFAFSTVLRGYACMGSDDGLAASNASRDMNDDGCVGLVQGGSRVGRLDVDAVLATGMRFIIDQVFTQPISVGLLALGGDLVSAGQVTHVGPDDACATDPVDVTGYGFDPAAGISIGANETLTTGSSLGRLILAMFRSVAQQGVVALASDNDVGTSETSRYNRDADIALARVRPSQSIAYRNSFNALITDGFRLNCLEDDGDSSFIAGLLGGSYHIETFLTRTTLGTIILTPGFEVAGGIIMSHNTSESVDNDTGQLDNSASIGAFSGVIAALQACYYAFDLSGVGTTQVTAGRRGGSVYMRGDEAASPAIDGSIEVTAIGATTVTLTQSVADPAAAQCIAILFGVRAAAPSGLVPSLALLGVGQ